MISIRSNSFFQNFPLIRSDTQPFQQQDAVKAGATSSFQHRFDLLATSQTSGPSFPIRQLGLLAPLASPDADDANYGGRSEQHSNGGRYRKRERLLPVNAKRSDNIFYNNSSEMGNKTGCFNKRTAAGSAGNLCAFFASNYQFSTSSSKMYN